MHPEYPCAHCIQTAAGATVLDAFFGDTVPTFSLTNPTAPGVTRRFSRLSDYVSESIDAPTEVLLTHLALQPPSPSRLFPRRSPHVTPSGPTLPRLVGLVQPQR